MPADVRRPPQSECDHPGADRPVRGSGRWMMKDPVFLFLLIGIKGDGERGRDIAEADLVQFEGFRRKMIAGIDVDLVFQVGDRGRHYVGAEPNEVRSSWNEGVLAHPR